MTEVCSWNMDTGGSWQDLSTCFGRLWAGPAQDKSPPSSSSSGHRGILLQGTLMDSPRQIVMRDFNAIQRCKPACYCKLNTSLSLLFLLHCPLPDRIWAEKLHAKKKKPNNNNNSRLLRYLITRQTFCNQWTCDVCTATGYPRVLSCPASTCSRNSRTCATKTWHRRDERHLSPFCTQRVTAIGQVRGRT